ncbi:nucleotidyltransferase family protein [Candidatus Oscillochloris fontis]|uniref:nucleotidyltransferase family protein n=1 Tax=Candidatus Oscillochloris fontis TaxID=2496868 RepID=UPI00101D01F2|nr:sugar phosphate nucleotidyltransferase [Candidatus Oscillochloris fontis]
MNDLIGLLPAAGRGSRLGPIPCSKEIMPLGFRPTQTTSLAWHPVTAMELHLHALRQAGARRAVVIISESKADIVRYIGDGSRYGVAVAYVYQQQLQGLPFALSLARDWIGSSTTLFSMPDTLITPPETMARVSAFHQRHGVDVTLGLFSTTTPHKFGMVEQDDQGRLVYFIEKPAQSNLHLMWGMAAWSPRFTEFLTAHLADQPPQDTEYVMSGVFNAALKAGLTIQGIPLLEAHYHDIGTPEDFQSGVLRLALEQDSRFDDMR